MTTLSRLLIAALVLVATGCAPDAEPAKPAKPAESKGPLDDVKKALADGSAVIVDVRSQSEWDAGHLNDAIFLPITALSKDAESEGFAEQIEKKIPKGKKVYTHCGRGVRAAKAAEILGKIGYEVKSLNESYAQLVEAGLPPAGK